MPKILKIGGRNPVATAESPSTSHVPSGVLMRLRTAAAVSLAAVAVAGTSTPAVAGPQKPITKKYDANATPDPSTSNVTEICDPVTPTAKHSTEFKVPAAGSLKVELGNTLDWAIGLRVGGKLVASADGASPETKEVVMTKLKKATVVTIDVCNFAGELVVPVTVTYTPAKK